MIATTTFYTNIPYSNGKTCHIAKRLAPTDDLGKNIKWNLLVKPLFFFSFETRRLTSLLEVLRFVLVTYICDINAFFIVILTSVYESICNNVYYDYKEVNIVNTCVRGNLWHYLSDYKYYFANRKQNYYL